MPQCIVLNVTDRDDWIDQTEHPNRNRAIGLHVPAKDRPTLVHHTPEDCSESNLRALCQRHHLAHDHEHHRANSQATRRAKSGTLELFP